MFHRGLHTFYVLGVHVWQLILSPKLHIFGLALLCTLRVLFLLKPSEGLLLQHSDIASPTPARHYQQDASLEHPTT